MPQGVMTGLRALLDCGVCGERAPGPKLLPCLHTFCLPCLHRHWAPQAHTQSSTKANTESTQLLNGTRKEQNCMPETVSCPTCQHQFTLPQGGPQMLRDNCLVEDMKSVLPVEPPCPPQDKSNNIIADLFCQKCQVKDLNLKSHHDGVYNQMQKDQNGASEDVESVQCYCASCDAVFTLPGVNDAASANSDPRFRHQEHMLSLVEDICDDKLEYLKVTFDEFQHAVANNQEQLVQLDNCQEHLSSSHHLLATEIKARAAHLTALIEARKVRLLKELEATCRRQKSSYNDLAKTLNARHQHVKHANLFGKVLMTAACPDTQVALCEDVTARMHHLMQQNGHITAEVLSMRMDVPELGRDDLQLERAFGSLVMGTVQCGQAQCLKSFNIDLTWPTGIATTHNQDLVITGKKGAFEDQGHVMFYNRNGDQRACRTLEGSSVPNDAAMSKDGNILVSDNCGQVLQFSPLGTVLGVMTDVFKGVGRLATFNKDNSFVVTSSEEKCVYIYDEFGETKKRTLPKSDTTVELTHPHYVTTNSKGDIIVSDFKQHATYAFSRDGDLQFQYRGTGTERGQLQCPSAVCCDAFDNVLIADFMHDRVHLVSRSGQFLGYLLAADNGVTCPNFLHVDSDGHLFIGQYGGDISVFQYLSFVRHM